MTVIITKLSRHPQAQICFHWLPLKQAGRGSIVVVLFNRYNFALNCPNTPRFIGGGGFEKPSICCWALRHGSNVKQDFFLIYKLIHQILGYQRFGSDTSPHRADTCTRGNNTGPILYPLTCINLRIQYGSNLIRIILN